MALSPACIASIGLLQGEIALRVMDTSPWITQITIIVSLVAIWYMLERRVPGAVLMVTALASLLLWLTQPRMAGQKVDTLTQHWTLLPSLHLVQFEFTYVWHNLAECMPVIFALGAVAVMDIGAISKSVMEAANVVPRKTSLDQVFFSCGVATMLAAFLGVTPIVVHSESLIGVGDGGKRWMPVVTGCFFLCSIPAAHVLESVPIGGSCPALLYVSFVMLESIRGLEWGKRREIPACIILLLGTIGTDAGFVKGLSLCMILFAALHVLPTSPPP